MKIPLLILTFAFCAACTSMAQTASSSHTPNKQAAPIGTKGVSIAICQVNFGVLGDIKSKVMVKSTGSKVLDDKLIETTGESLHGPGNGSLNLPIPYEKVDVTTPHGKVAVYVAFPKPPYPFQARAANAQGSGLVRVSFDVGGIAVGAEMAKSTGSKILDGNSINYALKSWKSSGGEKLTTTIPLAYHLR